MQYMDVFYGTLGEGKKKPKHLKYFSSYFSISPPTLAAAVIFFLALILLFIKENNRAR